MEQMKFDCGGSAAVLGAARAIGMLEPEGVEAHFIVAACENMINQKAMVPSDILTASNGKVCILYEIHDMHTCPQSYEPFSGTRSHIGLVSTTLCSFVSS
jgi:Cytosol aminopeptidase family, catalytic domain